MESRDLRGCSCACTLWNHLISDCKKLRAKRNCLDPFRQINIKHSFDCSQGRILICRVGICIFDNKVLTTDYVCDKVFVFSLDGKPLGTFGSKGNQARQFDGTYGICKHGDYLLVGDFYNHRIQVFDRNYNFCESISLGRSAPKGICSGPEILVTTDAEEILIVNLEEKSVGKFCSINAQGICCNSKNEIVVVDCANHQVQIFNRGGEFLRKFDSQGVPQGYLQGRTRSLCG